MFRNLRTMPSETARKLSISLPAKAWLFVERDAKEQNHFNKSRVISEALDLLRSRRERRTKYEATAK
jgi:hypothetical protein